VIKDFEHFFKHAGVKKLKIGVRIIPLPTAPVHELIAEISLDADDFGLPEVADAKQRLAGLTGTPETPYGFIPPSTHCLNFSMSWALQGPSQGISFAERRP